MFQVGKLTDLGCKRKRKYQCLGKFLSGEAVQEARVGSWPISWKSQSTVLTLGPKTEGLGLVGGKKQYS